MNKYIWIGSLCILIILILILLYYTQQREGFENTEIQNARSILTIAQTSVETAKSILNTANTAITDITTINTANAAVDKAKTAMTAANDAVIKANAAVTNINSVVSSTQTQLSKISIAELQKNVDNANATSAAANKVVSDKELAGSSYTNAKNDINPDIVDSAAAKQKNALNELNTAKNEQKTALDAVNTAQSNYDTENNKLSTLQNNNKPYSEQVSIVAGNTNNVAYQRSALAELPSLKNKLITLNNQISTRNNNGRTITDYEIGYYINDRDNVNNKVYPWSLTPNPLEKAITELTNSNAKLATLTNYQSQINSQTTIVNNTKDILTNATAKKSSADTNVQTKQTIYAAAQAKLEKAQTIFDLEKAAYDKAKNDVAEYIKKFRPEIDALNNAKVIQNIYNDAIIIQTDANITLTAANAVKNDSNNALTKANNAAAKIITDTRLMDKTFIDAATLANKTLPINEFIAMSAAWTAYMGLPASTPDSIAAIDTLIIKYKTFKDASAAYTSAVINAIPTFQSTEKNYVVKNDPIKILAGYFDMKVYTDLVAALNSIKATDPITQILTNYNNYITKKGEFQVALAIAEGNRTYAGFISNLDKAKNDVATWIAAAPKGCRRVQTIATTDSDMLDQDIVCSENEYISGYNKVKGFDAAPVDPKVSIDNIQTYLAVKYSCCTAPTGIKGPKGKPGLPGLDGDPGAMGPAGPVGAAGPAGNKGEPGDMGEEGGKGPLGDTGENGMMGAVGLPGKPGISVTVPHIRQLPGPMGPPGEVGPRGIQGPKGADGKIVSEPVRPPTRLDKTIELINIQDKINNYVRSGNKKKVQPLHEESPSMLQGKTFQTIH